MKKNISRGFLKSLSYLSLIIYGKDNKYREGQKAKINIHEILPNTIIEDYRNYSNKNTTNNYELSPDFKGSIVEQLKNMDKIELLIEYPNNNSYRQLADIIKDIIERKNKIEKAIKENSALKEKYNEMIVILANELIKPLEYMEKEYKGALKIPSKWYMQWNPLSAGLYTYENMSIFQKIQCFYKTMMSSESSKNKDTLILEAQWNYGRLVLTLGGVILVIYGFFKVVDNDTEEEN